jgi:O-antigen/teichoic acid export membrane protein
LRQSILRFVPLHENTTDKQALQTTLVAAFGIQLFASTLLATTGMYFLGDSPERIRITVALFAGLQSTSLLTSFLQAERKAGAFLALSLVQCAAQITAAIIIIICEMNSARAAAATVLSGHLIIIIVGVVKRWWPSVRMHSFRRDIRTSTLVEALRFGMPLALWLVCFQSITLAGRIALERVGSPAEVARFASSADLAGGIISLLMTPYLMAAHPIVMQLSAKGSHTRMQVEQVVSSSLKHSIITVAPIVALAASVGPVGLTAIFGAEYALDRLSLFAIAANAAAAGAAMYVHKGLEVTGRTTQMLMCVIIAAGANTLIIAITAREFGTPAVAASALLSTLLYILLTSRIAKADVAISISRPLMAKLVFAAIATGVVALTMHRILSSGLSDRASVVGATLMASMSYLVILTVVGEMRPRAASIFVWRLIRGFAGWKRDTSLTG